MGLYRDRFFLLFLGLALVFSTGCGGGGGSGSTIPNISAGNTTLSGSILLTDPTDKASLRADAAPTEASIGLYYLTAGGLEVPLKLGVIAQIIGNKANYSFNFDYDTVASARRNFILKAKLNNNQIIEGVIPMNLADKKVDASPITPFDNGMARFVKEAAIKGNPDVSIGDLMSMFPPKVIFGLTDADLKSLAEEFVNRETRVQSITTAFGGEVAEKIAQLREFACEAARDIRDFTDKYPELTASNMRERYEEMMRNRARTLGLPADAIKAIEGVDLLLVQGIGDRTATMNLPSEFAGEFRGMGLAIEARSRMDLLSQTLKAFVTYSDITDLIKAFDLALEHMYSVVQNDKPVNLDEFMYVDPAIMIFEKARFIIFKDLGLLEKSPDSAPLIFALLPKPEDFGTIINPPVDFNDDSVWILPYPGKGEPVFAATTRNSLRSTIEQIGDPLQLADFQKTLMNKLMQRINENFSLLKFAATPPPGAARDKLIEALAVLLAEPIDPSVYGFDPDYNPGNPGSEPGWEGPEPVDPIFDRLQKFYGTLIELETPISRNDKTFAYALKEAERDGTVSTGGWTNQYQAYICATDNEFSDLVGKTGVFILKFLSGPVPGTTPELNEAPGFTYVEYYPDPN
ncbi:MAG: hypothetical protein KKB51_10600 [Candidatus Riflebacteria bacterium]|nr:hypothetical protein [Candidatus Riflebacteria bacterium]